MLGDAKLVGERWALQRHIGSGSFAVVWKAQHVATGKTVAMKEIKEITNKKLMQARCLQEPRHTPARANSLQWRSAERGACLGMQSLAGEISILKQITHPTSCSCSRLWRCAPPLSRNYPPCLGLFWPWCCWQGIYHLEPGFEVAKSCMVLSLYTASNMRLYGFRRTGAYTW